MQSKRRKKLIIANSILLVMLVAGFTYAWFASNYGNSVDGDQIEVIADSALEISFTGEEDSWKSYLNLDENDSIDFNNLEFKDITGSGDGTFFRPALDQYSGYAQVNSAGEWATPEENIEYVKFDLYMRSTDRLDVYLGEGSAVDPLSTTLIGTNAGNKSPRGDFSRDLVAGAVRLSLTHESEGHLFTWIPRPNIYLNAGPSEAITTYDITTSATSGESFTHTYYAEANADSTTPLDETKTVTGDITSSSQKIISLSTQKGSYYQEKVTVYIWLEGCDNEARRAFVGGKFKISLALAAADTTA